MGKQGQGGGGGGAGAPYQPIRSGPVQTTSPGMGVQDYLGQGLANAMNQGQGSQPLEGLGRNATTPPQEKGFDWKKFANFMKDYLEGGGADALGRSLGPRNLSLGSPVRGGGTTASRIGGNPGLEGLGGMGRFFHGRR